VAVSLVLVARLDRAMAANTEVRAMTLELMGPMESTCPGRKVGRDMAEGAVLVAAGSPPVPPAPVLGWFHVEGVLDGDPVHASWTAGVRGSNEPELVCDERLHTRAELLIAIDDVLEPPASQFAGGLDGASSCPPERTDEKSPSRTDVGDTRAAEDDRAGRMPRARVSPDGPLNAPRLVNAPDAIGTPAAAERADGAVGAGLARPVSSLVGPAHAVMLTLTRTCDRVTKVEFGLAR